MNKIKQVLKSRTFWLLVLGFLVNGVTAIHDSVPSGWLPYVDALIAIAATYTHVNPSQDYK